MSVATLLERLDGVRSTGNGRWLARCPAHEDRSPSLSVRELDDGAILLHDFAGCSVHEVLTAVGMTLSDLFPNNDGTHDHRRRGERRPFPAVDVLRAIEREALIAASAASLLGNGGALTNDDRARLILAAQRITAAVLESRHA